MHACLAINFIYVIINGPGQKRGIKGIVHNSDIYIVVGNDILFFYNEKVDIYLRVSDLGKLGDAHLSGTRSNIYNSMP